MWGEEPERGLIGFHALAGSRLAINSSHFVPRASSESRLASDCTAGLGLTTDWYSGPCLDHATCLAASEIMPLLRWCMRRGRCVSCTWKESIDSSTVSENARQLASLDFHRAFLRESDVTGVWQRSYVMIGRWSESRSSHPAHSALLAKIDGLMICLGS